MDGVKAAQHPGDELWLSTWAESEGERTIRERSKVECDSKLYCSWFCPYAQRAWIALEEKQVPFQYVEINPYEVDPNETGGYTKKQLSLKKKRELHPGFVETSPRGLVPALRDGADAIWDSWPLIEYINERYGEPDLMPKSVVGRAKVRIWAAHAETRVQKSYYVMLMAQTDEQQESAKNRLLDELRTMAQAMEESGPYFMGDQFTLVDIAIAPFYQRMLWVGSHYRGLVFPSANSDPEFARLAKWWDAVSNRRSVAATIVCRPRLIASYRQYEQGVGTSDYAKNLQSSLVTNTKSK